MLRRKSLGYLYHSCAYLHNCDGSYGVALANMRRSFFWYPLPYRRDEVGTTLERPKRLAVILARMLGLKRPARPEERTDAPRIGMADGMIQTPASGWPRERAFAPGPPGATPGIRCRESAEFTPLTD